MWNHFLQTLKANFFFKTFRRLVSNWFDPNCNLAVICMINPRVLLRTKPTLEFGLSYFTFLM